MKTRFSVVIPCFNEGKNIEILLEQVKESILSQGIEVILVNNGSNDESVKIFKLLSAKKVLGLKVINLSENAGYGGGILAGLNEADGEYIGWTHADLQTDIKDLINAFCLAEKHTFVKGRRVGRNLFENFFSIGMAIFESLILRSVLWEINAQPNVFHNSFFKTWKNPPKDFSLDLFAYYQAKKLDFDIKRIKVRFPPRKFGHSSWNSGLASRLRLIKRTIEYSLKLRKNIS